MRLRPLISAVIVACFAVLAWGGCSAPRQGGMGSSPDKAALGTTLPAAAGTPIVRPDLGVQLVQPAGWVAQPSSDFVLLIRPAGSSEMLPAISLDVPELPFHIPGLIPMGAVRSGYLDDLRKQVGAITVEDLPPPDADGATGRLVRSTWQAGGQAVRETALLLVHDDRVYILRARAGEADEARVRGAFDEIVRSMRWVKVGKQAAYPWPRDER